MRIRIQPNKICKKLPTSWRVEKDKKDCSKVEKNGACPHLLTVIKKNSTNFLAFFLFFPLKFFPFPVRIQEVKWMRIHADLDPQPCGQCWCFLLLKILLCKSRSITARGLKILLVVSQKPNWCLTGAGWGSWCPPTRGRARRRSSARPPRWAQSSSGSVFRLRIRIYSVKNRKNPWQTEIHRLNSELSSHAISIL